jgi:hypothetical protein
LDISKHVNVFDAVIAFISVIAQTPNVEVNIAKFVQSSDQQQLDDQRVTIDVLGTLLTDRNDLFNQVVSGHADYQETMKSISHLLEKLKGLHTNIELYLNKVKKSKPAPSQTAGSKKKQRKIQFELPGEVLPIISENEDPTGSAIIAKGNTLAEEEEGLDKTLNFIIDACTAIERSNIFFS